jgi:2-phospho-L-lactate guanylyltransferase
MTCLQQNIWAIIPVKPLAAGKSRLSHILSARQRACLIGRFLQRSLETLAQVPSVRQIAVISSDRAALDIAGQQGALAVAEDRPRGLNVAVTEAVGMATGAGAAGVLVLPADLPFVQVADVETMIAAAASVETADSRNQPQGKDCLNIKCSLSLTLCSDNKGEGTNALLLYPPVEFTFSYGPGSFRRHVEEARRRHIPYRIVHAPGLKFDLDTEDDWLIYRETRQLIV